MPATNHFTFVKGEDVEIDWTIVSSAAENAPGVNVNGLSFVFKVKRRDADADPSLVASTTSIVTASDGLVKTLILEAEMALLKRGDYRCSLWRTTAPKACLSRGNFSVLDSTQDNQT